MHPVEPGAVPCDPTPSRAIPSHPEPSRAISSHLEPSRAISSQKGVYTIAVGPGFPIHYSGPHIGTRHDARLFQECRFLQARIKPWEYGLGDKAYVGEPQIITEFKGNNLTAAQHEFNLTLQHYRGRVEHLIGELVLQRKTLNTKWRGSYSLLAAIMKISAHMVGLQERMKGPRYDVFGPWPVCPPHIVAAYP